MNAWRAYRRYLTEVDQAQQLYGHPDWFELDPSPTQAAWDAIPLWFRCLLCARCGWRDAVYEVSPRLGEWLVQRRVEARSR